MPEVTRSHSLAGVSGLGQVDEAGGGFGPLVDFKRGPSWWVHLGQRGGPTVMEGNSLLLGVARVSIGTLLVPPCVTAVAERYRHVGSNGAWCGCATIGILMAEGPQGWPRDCGVVEAQWQIGAPLTSANSAPSISLAMQTPPHHRPPQRHIPHSPFASKRSPAIRITITEYMIALLVYIEISPDWRQSSVKKVPKGHI